MAINRFEVKSQVAVVKEETVRASSRRGAASAAGSSADNQPIKYTVDSDLDIVDDEPVIAKFVKAMAAMKGHASTGIRKRHTEFNKKYAKGKAPSGR